MTESDASMSSSELWFESGGTRLYAREAGRGVPILLLHGTLASHAAVRPIAADLARNHRVITPDLRGAGSSIWRGTLDYDLLADDLVALLRELDLETAVVAGVSSGAGAALRVALRHPERVTALALVRPLHGGAEVPFSEAQRATFAAMHGAARRCLGEGMGALHGLFMPLPEGVRERALAMVDGFDPESTAATTALLASDSQPFARADELTALRCPVLLVRGHDALHPPEVSALYERAIEGCRVEAADCDVAGAIARWVTDFREAGRIRDRPKG